MKSSLVWNHQVMMRGLHRYGASSRRLYSKPNMNINCNTQENPFAFASDWTRGEFSWVIWKSLKDKNLLNSPLDAIIGSLRVGFGKLELYLLCTEHLAIYYVQQSQPLSTDPLHIVTMYRASQLQPSTIWWCRQVAPFNLPPLQYTACQYCQYCLSILTNCQWQYWQQTVNTANTDNTLPIQNVSWPHWCTG